MAALMIDTAHIPELDKKGLRSFGFTFGTLFALLFGLLLPWIFDHDRPLWPWLLLAFMVLWGVAAPRTLRPLYIAWMSFGLFMSRFTTPLIMGLVFYIVITPAGFLFRLFAQDPMRRDWDADADTYRNESEHLPPDRLRKPF